MTYKMNRMQISIGDTKELENKDKKYWSNACIEEKLKTITFLRECFYGPEATTGRLQKIFELVK